MLWSTLRIYKYNLKKINLISKWNDYAPSLLTWEYVGKALVAVFEPVDIRGEGFAERLCGDSIAIDLLWI